MKPSWLRHTCLSAILWLSFAQAAPSDNSAWEAEYGKCDTKAGQSCDQIPEQVRDEILAVGKKGPDELAKKVRGFISQIAKVDGWMCYATKPKDDVNGCFDHLFKEKASSAGGMRYQECLLKIEAGDKKDVLAHAGHVRNYYWWVNAWRLKTCRGKAACTEAQAGQKEFRDAVEKELVTARAKMIKTCEDELATRTTAQSSVATGIDGKPIEAPTIEVKGTKKPQITSPDSLSLKTLNAKLAAGQAPKKAIDEPEPEDTLAKDFQGCHLLFHDRWGQCGQAAGFGFCASWKKMKTLPEHVICDVESGPDTKLQGFAEALVAQGSYFGMDTFVDYMRTFALARLARAYRQLVGPGDISNALPASCSGTIRSNLESVVKKQFNNEDLDAFTKFYDMPTLVSAAGEIYQLKLATEKEIERVKAMGGYSFADLTAKNKAEAKKQAQEIAAAAPYLARIKAYESKIFELVKANPILAAGWKADELGKIKADVAPNIPPLVIALATGDESTRLQAIAANKKLLASDLTLSMAKVCDPKQVDYNYLLNNDVLTAEAAAFLRGIPPLNEEKCYRYPNAAKTGTEEKCITRIDELLLCMKAKQGLDAKKKLQDSIGVGAGCLVSSVALPAIMGPVCAVATTAEAYHGANEADRYLDVQKSVCKTGAMNCDVTAIIDAQERSAQAWDDVYTEGAQFALEVWGVKKAIQAVAEGRKAAKIVNVTTQTVSEVTELAKRDADLAERFLKVEKKFEQLDWEFIAKNHPEAKEAIQEYFAAPAIDGAKAKKTLDKFENAIKKLEAHAERVAPLKLSNQTGPVLKSGWIDDPSLPQFFQPKGRQPVLISDGSGKVKAGLPMGNESQTAQDIAIEAASHPLAHGKTAYEVRGNIVFANSKKEAAEIAAKAGYFDPAKHAPHVREIKLPPVKNTAGKVQKSKFGWNYAVDTAAASFERNGEQLVYFSTGPGGKAQPLKFGKPGQSAADIAADAAKNALAKDMGVYEIKGKIIFARSEADAVDIAVAQKLVDPKLGPVMVRSVYVPGHVRPTQIAIAKTLDPPPSNPVPAAPHSAGDLAELPEQVRKKLDKQAFKLPEEIYPEVPANHVSTPKKVHWGSGPDSTVVKPFEAAAAADPALKELVETAKQVHLGLATNKAAVSSSMRELVEKAARKAQKTPPYDKLLKEGVIHPDMLLEVIHEEFKAGMPGYKGFAEVPSGCCSPYDPKEWAAVMKKGGGHAPYDVDFRFDSHSAYAHQVQEWLTFNMAKKGELGGVSVNQLAAYHARIGDDPKFQKLVWDALYDQPTVSKSSGMSVPNTVNGVLEQLGVSEYKPGTKSPYPNLSDNLKWKKDIQKLEPAEWKSGPQTIVVPPKTTQAPPPAATNVAVTSASDAKTAVHTAETLPPPPPQASSKPLGGSTGGPSKLGPVHDPVAFTKLPEKARARVNPSTFELPTSINTDKKAGLFTPKKVKWEMGANKPFLEELPKVAKANSSLAETVETAKQIHLALATKKTVITQLVRELLEKAALKAQKTQPYDKLLKNGVIS